MNLATLRVLPEKSSASSAFRTLSKEPRALALVSLRRPTPLKIPIGDVQQAITALVASEPQIPRAEFEWQFLGLIAALRITMPSSHSAFDAFLLSRTPLFENLEATKESLELLDHSIASDSDLLSRSALAEFAANIPALYIERAVSALEKYFQQFYQRIQASNSNSSKHQAAALEPALACFEALCEFDLKRTSFPQEVSTRRPLLRLLPRVLKPLRAYITALLPSALSALNTRITQDMWRDSETARPSDRLAPLLRRFELLPPTPTPSADTMGLPPRLSALVERSLTEWLPLDELVSRLELPAAFGTLSARVPGSLLAQLERAASNPNYNGRRALALLHSDAAALGLTFSVLRARRHPAAADPLRALLSDLCTRCFRIARSACERLLARESRALVCTLFDARAFDWAESREFFEVLHCLQCLVFPTSIAYNEVLQNSIRVESSDERIRIAFAGTSRLVRARGVAPRGARDGAAGEGAGRERYRKSSARTLCSQGARAAAGHFSRRAPVAQTHTPISVRRSLLDTLFSLFASLDVRLENIAAVFLKSFLSSYRTLLYTYIYCTCEYVYCTYYITVQYKVLCEYIETLIVNFVHFSQFSIRTLVHHKLSYYSEVSLYSSKII